MSIISDIWDRFSRPASAPRIEPQVTGIGAQILGGHMRAVRRMDTPALLAAYRQSPILQMVVRKIAEGVASVDWQAKQKLADGVEQRVPGHIIERLLNGGVPGLDGYRCRMVIEQHLLLGGESLWVLDRNAMLAPIQRWPIPPHWIQEIALPGRPYFVITSPYGGAPLQLGVEDVVYIKDVDPFDPYGRGAGVAGSLSDEINADEAAAKHLAATFMTGGVPRTIVTGGEKTPLDDDSMQRLETAWEQKYSSIAGQAKPFFSKANIGVHQLAPNFKDMDLSNIRAYERDIMISVFGIPPELVGVLQNSNRATIESAEFLFTKHVVLPRANAQRSAINDQLAPQFDPSLMIDFESPVDEDMEFRRTVMKDNAGSFMIDEHREMAGLEPLPEEAGRVLPQSFTTLLVRPEELGTPPDVLAGTAPVAEDFDEVERAVIAKMVTKNSDDNIENALNAIGDEDPMITDVLARAAGEAAEDFAKAQLGQLSVEVSFDVRDPRVEAIIRERAAESSKLINGTTRSELQQSLADGFAKGESTDQLVARIREVVRDAGVRRAKMISRTEITRASNFGTNEALDLAGVQEREWLATFDDNVRDRHAELDKQRRGSGQPFEIDGYSAMYPGDFGVGHMDINCRCGLIPVFEIEEIRRPTVWKAYDARRAPHERRLAINLDAAFKAQYGRVLAAFL